MMLECGCPSDYPHWHEQDVDLGGQCVHRLPCLTFLHMPIAYELYLQRQQQEIDQLELPESWPGFVLTRTGILGGELIRPLHPVQSPSRRVSYLPRPFHGRGYLHEGDVGTIRQSVRTLQANLLDAGRLPKELYLCYLTCPGCRDQRGGDRILLVRRWVESPRLARRIAGR